MWFYLFFIFLVTVAVPYLGLMPKESWSHCYNTKDYCIQQAKNLNSAETGFKTVDRSGDRNFSRHISMHHQTYFMHHRTYQNNFYVFHTSVNIIHASLSMWKRISYDFHALVGTFHASVNICHVSMITFYASVNIFHASSNMTKQCSAFSCLSEHISYISEHISCITKHDCYHLKVTCYGTWQNPLPSWGHVVRPGSHISDGSTLGSRVHFHAHIPPIHHPCTGHQIWQFFFFE